MWFVDLCETHQDYKLLNEEQIRMSNFEEMKERWEPRSVVLKLQIKKEGFRDAEAKEEEIFIEDDIDWAESTVEDVQSHEDPDKWALLTESLGIKQQIMEIHKVDYEDVDRLASKTFPCLFRNCDGDPFIEYRETKITVHDMFSHLLKVAYWY